MRLGVFLPNWVGDVVMATPAILALRGLVGEDGQLIGIMRPYVSEVLAGTEWFDQQILYDKPRNRFRIANPEVHQAIRTARLDTVVVLPNSMRTAWMAWRSGARRRIGYRGEGRALMLTDRIAQPRTADGRQIATIDGYLNLAQVAGCKELSPRLELGTTPADEQAADSVWRQLRLPQGNQLVILNSGGAYGAAKQWPAEHFSELARMIAHGDEFSVLVNCGPGERDIARNIVAKASHPGGVFSLAEFEDLPVGLTKACIRRSRLLVTTDSGPRFFGVAFGRPVVTLFGPTDPRLTETRYDAETSLSLSLDCQPCMARTCPLVHHRCMRELSVEKVYDAVARALQRTPVVQVA